VSVNPFPFPGARGGHRARFENGAATAAAVCSSTTCRPRVGPRFRRDRIGAEYLHCTYKAKDSGVAGQVGVRQRFRKILAVRLDGHVDFMPNSREQVLLIAYNGNWELESASAHWLNR